ncbi:hypothetical protein B484DRAFT_408182 [Ochromonadaceae sp. CCMP2298]|nr:hypothetical protein B484DRAFT_408182 [Ochromonadaceae sp. CCMP2298]|mmetsp:Transcript_20151/g.44794  ORF Transcript_20151/g.44794 Transcript_20151/m.44794 type:complete len:301 (-) Transcript_20151:78-980(-)
MMQCRYALLLLLLCLHNLGHGSSNLVATQQPSTGSISTGIGSSTSTSSPVIPYLQSELSATSTAQQGILAFLHAKQVPLGQLPGSLRSKGASGGAADLLSRITVSTKQNHVECRISLGRAALGAKCVAPCGCSGSQKWVQFSELNKLRRKDPSQWTSCRTCQQPFDYQAFAVYGGLPANVVGYVLDHMAIVRGGVVVVVAAACSLLDAGALLSRVLTSKALWQQFPQWSKFTHIPLALKFWALKILLQFAAEKYLQVERNVLLSYLADVETRLIEENLPVEGEMGEEGEEGEDVEDVEDE